MALIDNPYAPLPAFQKTWQFKLASGADSVNQLVDAETTASLQAASTMLALLTSMLGFSLNPWVMRRCCDSLTVKTDGTNLFTDKTKFVGAAAGSAHSWLVIRNSLGQEICVDFSSASGVYIAAMYISAAAGFTGGSTTNRPTATDERSLRGSTASPIQWLAGTAGVNVRLRLHVMHSTDGLATKAIVTYQGVALSILTVEKVSEGVGSWAVPAIASWIGTAGGGSLTSTFAQDWRNCLNFQLIVADGPSGLMDIRVTPEICAGSNAQSFSSSRFTLTESAAGRESGYSGKWHVFGFGYYSRTSGMLGRHGRSVDRWIMLGGPNLLGSLATGELLTAADGSRSVAVLGNWLIPWPTETPAVFF